VDGHRGNVTWAIPSDSANRTVKSGKQPMSDDEIQKLVQRAQSGDGAAFAALYDVFAPRLFRYFRFRSSTTEAAEDLTQRVFLKMIEQLPTYKSRGIPFAAWLFRVARNAWIDEDRTNHPSLPLEAIAESPSDASGPEALAAASLDSDALHKAVAALPPDQREVIAGRFFAGLTPRETAALMGRSEGSVRVLQHRALAALRGLLPQMDPAPGDGVTRAPAQ
jgi:RNA polymerase sigma-70 factor, ECF subfamily